MVPEATSGGRSRLHTNVVEATAHARTDRAVAIGRVQANWGRVTVTLIEPAEAAGVSDTYSRRGFVFALGCQADPARRFTDGRRLTDAGRRQAERMLRRIVDHHQPVRAHAEPIAALWLRVAERIGRLERERDAVTDPRERRALRDRLRSGELDQPTYQRLRRQLVARDERRAAAFDGRARRVRHGFHSRTSRAYGQELDISLIAQLVRLSTIHERLPAAVRERIATVDEHKDRT